MEHLETAGEHLPSFEECEARFDELYTRRGGLWSLPALLRKVAGAQGRGAVAEVRGYIGSGTSKDAFTFRGQVVKVMRPPDRYAARLPFPAQVSPLIAGKDVPRLEQLVAVSERYNAMITTLQPGKSVVETSFRTLLGVTDDQLRQLDDTLGVMRERNLHPHNLQGVLFDPEQGFSFVDYEFNDPTGFRHRFRIDSTRDFLAYAFQDHVAIGELQELENHRMPVPTGSSYDDRMPGFSGSYERIIAQRAAGIRQVLNRFDTVVGTD